MIRVTTAAFVLILAGCALPPALQEGTAPLAPAPVVGIDDAAPHLLQYYEDLHGLSGREQAEEKERLTAALRPGVCDTARMKLALVLLRQAFVAPELLAPCLADPQQSSSVRDLAFLIESQFKALTSKEDRYEAALTEIERLRADNKTLLQQVEGLKAIERSLQDRDRLRQTREADGNESPSR